jgi:hypothetical protein
MKNRIVASAATLALTAAALVAAPSVAVAASDVPVVDIAVAGNQATISQNTMRPGVVEFHVGDTFTVPGENGGPDSISIVRTDQLDTVLALLPQVFAGDPSNPASLAAAAQGMRSIHALTTFYGGATKGGVWQVALPAGNYYALGVQSTAMGMAKPVPFTVAGQPRSAAVHAVQAAFWATGPVGENKWRFAQLGRQPVEWYAFRNNAQEIHFLNLSGVKASTTDGQVKGVFAAPDGPPPKWFTGPNISFDVVSPGVRVAIKGPLAAGRYLVDCFIPSETDGMPHAIMGMWRLVNVR